MALVDKIISGAQTGADQGGLYAARHLGIPTGGMCPKQCRTEDGDRPELIPYFNLIESYSRDYAIRTYENIRASDGTVIIGDVSEGGTKLTYQTCLVWSVPHLLLSGRPEFMPGAVDALRAWLATVRLHTLNVAGNRESKAPGICQWTYDVLIEALK